MNSSRENQNAETDDANDRRLQAESPSGGSPGKGRHPKPNAYPPWSPRFWNGMRLGKFWGLCWESRFRIHPLRYGLFAMVTLCGVVNSLFALCQRWIYGKRIRQTHPQPPMFVLGHWRSGTTLLHELLAIDPKMAYPSTFDCFAPDHFLLSQPLLGWLMALLLPGKRPMDRMKTGVDLPQEDEFALLAMGCPTPYRQLAFPNRGPVFDELIDMKNVVPDVESAYQKNVEYFFKALTVKYGKRLLLKSPPHTGRVGFFTRLYPTAKFVHISRHPDDVIPSTLHLWKTLYQIQGLQLPKISDEQLLEWVLTTFESMYRSYLGHRTNLPANQLIEVRFERLVAEPVATVKRIYEQLELDGFEEIKSALIQECERRSAYQVNPKFVSDELKQTIRSRLADYMIEFGYGYE